MKKVCKLERLIPVILIVIVILVVVKSFPPKGDKRGMELRKASRGRVIFLHPGAAGLPSALQGQGQGQE